MSLSIIEVNPVKAQIAELVLDASLSEIHKFKNNVTSYPIETGGDITDHIFNEPNDLSIEGFVTNSPTVVSTSSISQDRVLTAMETLLRIRSEKTLVRIVTALKTYEDMALVSIQFPRDARRGNALWFTSEWRPVVFARSESIPASDLRDINGTKTQAAPLDDKGNANTPEADAAQTEKAGALWQFGEFITAGGL